MRAVAIILVLTCHVYMMEASWARTTVIVYIAVTGLMGVQLFFVLSGFLIGRILIRSIRSGNNTWQDWRIFMARRWLRTLPLYWTVLLLLGWFWQRLFWAPQSGLLLPHLLAYGSLTQNLFWPLRDGWFGVSWTLAVEEWFYLSFSALLLGLARRLSPARALAVALLLFLLMPPILRWLSLSGSAWQEGDEHIVPFWFDALATGVMTSWLLERRRLSRGVGAACLAAGLAVVVFVWSGGLGWFTAFGRPLSRSVNYELLSIGFALCVPFCLSLRCLPAPLSLIVPRLSAWSYCLYLSHLSILEIAGFYRPRWQVPPPWLAAGCVGLTFLLSALSWRCFEQPILRLRPNDRRAEVNPTSARLGA